MFDNGVPRPGYSWTWIQRELAKVTTACWYDRAGSGWSDLGPYPRDSASQARELHALLQSAGIAPPYVLVAESSAALDARVYTGAHPDEVAGLVLVDSVHPDLLTAGWRSKRPRLPAQVRHSQDLAAQASNRLRLPISVRKSGAPSGI
jgi:pimeloyl-ACP methyl ester carboxylesterase